MNNIDSIADSSDVSFPAPESEILFFDGICGLCNTAVDFVLARDQRRSLLFSPLQGETAQRLLPEEDIRSLQTLVLWTNAAAYRRSSAVVRILWRLPRFWPLVGCLLWLVPFPLRDFGYQVVSKNRLRWFGQKETCRLPSVEERNRFLP